MVSTPIGNLGDMGFRAVETLKAADLVLCEDTRVTAKLLKHFGIKAKTESLNEHNEREKTPGIIKRVERGEVVALVSDAGTPLVSDPGYRLVEAASGAGIPVIPVPGASALLAALAVSGLPTDKFMFCGFTRNPGEFASVKATLVFYEAPHRLRETLLNMLEAFGDRRAAIAREVTKMHEEVKRGKISALAEYFINPRGEFVIVVEGKGEEKTGEEELEARLMKLLETNSVKEAVARLAVESGVSRKEIYDMALRLKNGNGV